MKVRAGTLIVTGIIALGAVAAALGLAIRRDRAPRAVVLVTLDTLRADRVGSGLTPEIDRVAAAGVTFGRAWTTAPLTVPAHASMLTGLLPPLHGLRTNAAGRRLPDAATRPYSTVAEVLRADGFRTGAFVSASVLRADRTGLDAGFDVFDDVPPAPTGALHDVERRADDTVDAALAWLRGEPGRAFLWVHLFDAHAPYDAPPPWGAGAAHVADAEGYDGEVRYVDQAVGRLRRGLAAAGFEHPVIVIVGDHGEALGAHGEPTHGYLLHEETLHVPLIVSAPGLVAAGGRRDDDVSVIDVAPTLVTLAGLSVPRAMGGRALFAGGREARPRAPYAESLYGWESSRWSQVFALRDGDRKIVDAGPQTLVFDLARDPGETAPTVLPALPGPDAADTDAAVRARVTGDLRRVAGLAALAAPAARADELAGGSYWSASAAPDGILARSENAALPSPYAQMDVLALLDRGRSLLAAGNAAGNATGVFRQAVERDPDNPQARRWLGRALLADGDAAEAAAAFRAAFERGWQHVDCLAKSLQASALAADAGDRGEAERGLQFLTLARGRGVRPNGAVYVFAALLHLARGDRDAARSALESARREPATPWLTRAVARVEERLR